MSVTRERLLDGYYERMAIDAGIAAVRSKAERHAMRRAFLRELSAGDDLWVFAYGSLTWNPTFHFAERRRGRIHGYHRSFCLWSHVGRGSHDNPGLMLGLDRGGACAGALYRIAAADVEHESALLWSREMMMPVYQARWLTARSEAGPVRAVGFVVDRACEQYAARLPTARLVAAMATASGALGSNFDYLRDLTDELDAMGIRDRALGDLRARVDAHLASLAPNG
jgi:cation transport protein ChaC